MTTTLATTTPVGLATVAAAMFTPVLWRGFEAGYKPALSSQLGATLAAAQDGGYILDEPDLIDAARVELSLRHGGRVDRLALLGSAGRLLAVAFDCVRLPGPVDPVDVICPWEGLTQRQAEAVRSLGGIVGDMLATAASWGIGRYPRIVAALQSNASLALAFTPVEAVLYRRVLAANLELAINAGQGGQP